MVIIQTVASGCQAAGNKLYLQAEEHKWLPVLLTLRPVGVGYQHMTDYHCVPSNRPVIPPDTADCTTQSENAFHSSCYLSRVS